MITQPFIMHLDVDGFAAAVERTLDPGLKGKPVVVGNAAGGRGVVACASYEARRFGIRAGMPLAAAQRRLPQAVFLPENPTEYERFSRRLFDLLSSAAPATEAATLDDFYLDLTGCERLYGGGNFLRWAGKLTRTIEGETGLPTSVGLAANKIVARIASSLAKPAHAVAVTPGNEAEFLEPVAVQLLPGVGEKTCLRLRELGIRHIGRLAGMGEEALRLLFGTQGSELWRRARGQFHEPVHPTALHRMISEEHVFAADTADGHVLEAAALMLAQKLAWQLRLHQVRTASARLMIVYNDGLSATHGLRLEYPSNHDLDFLAPARRALQGAFRRRVRVRRMQLSAAFIPFEDSQFDLFQERKREKNQALYRALDKVRARYGFEAIMAAAAKG
jgi:DNA polymerase IV